MASERYGDPNQPHDLPPLQMGDVLVISAYCGTIHVERQRQKAHKQPYQWPRDMEKKACGRTNEMAPGVAKAIAILVTSLAGFKIVKQETADDFHGIWRFTVE